MMGIRKLPKNSGKSGYMNTHHALNCPYTPFRSWIKETKSFYDTKRKNSEIHNASQGPTNFMYTNSSHFLIKLIQTKEFYYL